MCYFDTIKKQKKALRFQAKDFGIAGSGMKFQME